MKEAILKAGANDPSFTEIKLASGEVTEADLKELIKALRLNKFITKIEIVGDYEAKLSVECVKRLGQMLKSNQVLITLSLQYNGIDGRSIDDIVEGLKVNQVLTSLDLSINRLDDEAVAKLAKAIELNRTLKTLNLSQVNTLEGLSATGTKSIANALKNNPVLTDLDLSSNKIKSEETKEIAEVLKVTWALVRLDLSLNDIQTSGMAKIADALINNKTLRSLDVGYNNIKIDGAKHLIKTFKTNKTLTNVNIFPIGEGLTVRIYNMVAQLEHQIAKLCQNNRKLMVETNENKDEILLLRSESSELMLQASTEKLVIKPYEKEEVLLSNEEKEEEEEISISLYNPQDEKMLNNSNYSCVRQSLTHLAGESPVVEDN